MEGVAQGDQDDRVDDVDGVGLPTDPHLSARLLVGQVLAKVAVPAPLPGLVHWEIHRLLVTGDREGKVPPFACVGLEADAHELVA